MTNVTTTYYLWFVNASGRAGKALVYLDASGVTTNLGSVILLAWMVHPANDGVMVRFEWRLDYVFLWVQYSPYRAQQVKAATLGTSIPLTNNQSGLTFGTPTAATSGALSIQQDGTIPAGNTSVAGIGLHGAGTYASSISPDLKSTFTPTPDAEPPYRITFGVSAEVNDPIDPAKFPVLPGEVAFPLNVTSMTALLGEGNTWTIKPGDPWSSGVIRRVPKVRRTVFYKAGIGVIAVEDGIPDSYPSDVREPQRR